MFPAALSTACTAARGLSGRSVVRGGFRVWVGGRASGDEQQGVVEDVEDVECVMESTVLCEAHQL